MGKGEARKKPDSAATERLKADKNDWRSSYKEKSPDEESNWVLSV